MAKASYAPMFETVSGALNKINKKSPHASDQKMVLTTHRVAPTTSSDCSRVYLRGLSSVTRSTPVTAEETAARTKFAAVSAASVSSVAASSLLPPHAVNDMAIARISDTMTASQSLCSLIAFSFTFYAATVNLIIPLTP